MGEGGRGAQLPHIITYPYYNIFVILLQVFVYQCSVKKLLVNQPQNDCQNASETLTIMESKFLGEHAPRPP